MHRFLFSSTMIVLLLAAAPPREARSQQQVRLQVEQCTRQLRNPQVVLVFAPEPGMEDAATLASLRLRTGVRVVSCAMTNGGSTPSDLDNDPPIYVATRRKEETYQAMRIADVETWFLDMQDAAAAPDSVALARVWAADNLRKRIAEVIGTVRPDVVLVSRDATFPGGSSPRVEAVIRELVPYVRHNEEHKRRDEEPWRIARLLVEQARTAPSLPGAYSVPRTAEWETLDQRIAAVYRSLSVQRRIWNEDGRGNYAVVKASGKSPTGIIEGIPRLSGALVQVEQTVMAAADAAERVSWTNALPRVSAAIDSVQRRLVHEAHRLSVRDTRILVSWKQTLERLRCALLDVRVDFRVSDSTVTMNQLLFLNVDKWSARKTGGKVYIVFPAVRQERWIINEGQEIQTPLKGKDEFRIVTPESLIVTVPYAPQSLGARFMRERFPVIVYREHPDRKFQFEYRFDILLQVGPRHGLQVLTPIVRAVEGVPVRYMAKILSRDPVRTEVFVDDSLVQSDRRSLSLDRKDAAVIDTLHLRWRARVPDRDQLVKIKVGKRNWAEVVVRPIDVRVDSARVCGVLSTRTSSHLIDALTQMGHSPASVSCTETTGLARYTVLFLDRDLPAMNACTSADSLDHWVRGGGTLLVLPQHRSAGTPGSTLNRFMPCVPVGPSEPLMVDPRLSGGINALGGPDWDGWVVSRARSILEPGTGDTVLVRTGGGSPLVTEQRLGKGRVVHIALDLESQLANVHPGAFRILANLISLH